MKAITSFSPSTSPQPTLVSVDRTESIFQCRRLIRRKKPRRRRRWWYIPAKGLRNKDDDATGH